MGWTLLQPTKSALSAEGYAFLGLSFSSIFHAMLFWFLFFYLFFVLFCFYQEGVYPGAVHLDELNILLSERCVYLRDGGK
jgi:cellulose synthase/poly-beta-1,6-N-acetylglucosamine synthase-like glycosyltransferase